MSIFNLIHTHNWKKIKETYAPPVPINLDQASGILIERLYFGVTTILWECEKCQALKKEEMLGKEKKNDL